jgi:two-component system NtrC family sensor kinase
MTDERRSGTSIEGRVLLVDDDPLVLQAYSRLLHRLGCVVVTAPSGRAAVELLGGFSFDLIVSDINMDVMSGTQFLRAVREQDLDVPVILMTGNPEIETAVEAVDYGAFRYLAKPVALDTFAQAVRSAIHTHVVSQVLAEHVPLLDACSRIMGATCQGLEWDFAAIWMPSAGENPRCAETWSRPGYDAAAFDNVTRTTPLEPGRGLPGRVWASGSPEWIPDISVDSKFPRAPVAVIAGLRSGFAVPIAAEGEVFAVMEFFSRHHRGPDLGLLELFATSSAQLGAQVLRQRADQRAVRAEMAQRTVSSTLNSIMECVPGFIIAIDQNGNIQFINRVMPDYKMDDVIGSDWLRYLPPADHDQHRAHLRRVLATGVAETYETTVIGPDGGRLWFTTHMGPLRDNDRVVGAVLVAQEVTELKRTQAEVMAAQRLATVGTIAAGVAHEVNTPVQFVSDSVRFLNDAARDVFGVVERLQEVRRLATAIEPIPSLRDAIAAAGAAEEEADLAYLRENVPKAFERCLDGLERITTIVRSMKEFSHPAHHDMVPVDLNRALHATLTVARTEYKYVADLETDFGQIPAVTCHVNDINQVVLNLVVNAAHAIGDVVKGSDGKGKIKVRTWEEGEDMLISISDTGAGIPEAITQRIFEPFFTTKEVGKGTGQGLSLAWVIVKEKHGGDLTFKTKMGEGTTFVIRLPIAGKSSRQPAPQPAIAFSSAS